MTSVVFRHRVLLLAAGATLIGLLMFLVGGSPRLLQSTFQLPSGTTTTVTGPNGTTTTSAVSSDLATFISDAKSLTTPLTLVAVAIAPIACAVGAVLVLVGGRRGLAIIGTSLGVLVFLGSLTGLIN
jgi:hypothetical protein